SQNLIRLVVEIADRLRKTPELGAGLSVRATEEACIYLKHPILDKAQQQMLPEILKSSFCGRFSGRWNDLASDAGAAWSVIRAMERCPDCGAFAAFSAQGKGMPRTDKWTLLGVSVTTLPTEPSLLRTAIVTKRLRGILVNV